MLEPPAPAPPTFRTEFVSLKLPPRVTVEGGFVIELTWRFGTCCTVTVSAALVQLFDSVSSATFLGASAQAWTKNVPAMVSEYSVTVATGLAPVPGASAGTF